MSKLFFAISITLISIATFSCNKDVFLSEIPNSSIVIPKSLMDMRALLENEETMNQVPDLGQISSDEYYLPKSYWNTLSVKIRNAYVWSKDLFEGQGGVQDWNVPYRQIFYANIVLEGLSNLDPNENLVEYNSVKGAALFHRAFALYSVTHLFSAAYDSVTAASALGVPIRLSPNIDETPPRASVRDCYQQIIGDALKSVELLQSPVELVNRNRPSRSAALALLSRVYLDMGAYKEALIYSDSCLKVYGTLINYNTLSTTDLFPLTRTNSEVLFQCYLLSSTSILNGLTAPNCIIDSTLFKLYDSGDLRQLVFFRKGSAGNVNIKASYYGNVFPFGGLATDEVILIRAECYARLGSVQQAMNDLNQLRRNRYKTGTYMELTAMGPDQAIEFILAERRRELVFRGMRWFDLKRLGKMGTGVPLKRVLDGVEYSLLPKSAKYVFPLPPDVIILGGYQQNSRE